jgi:hypothetical protein
VNPSRANYSITVRIDPAGGRCAHGALFSY